MTKASSYTPVLLRADAGGRLGTGHLMRMLALAQACMRRGLEVSMAFAQCPSELISRVEAYGISCYPIGTFTPGSIDDAKATLGLSRQLDCQWAVTDGYHFKDNYQRHIKRGDISLMCVDDYDYSGQWYCDILLNQNLDAEKCFTYPGKHIHTELLLGSSYCLLREEFISQPNIQNEWSKIEHLVITMGGTDPDNSTQSTLELLELIPLDYSLRIRALVGANNPNLHSLQTFKSRHRIEILTDVHDMVAQYDWADGIISAGGTTCWEWLHAGIPGAIVTIADNQRPIVEALTVCRSAALQLGWPVNFSKTKYKRQLKSWLEHPESVINRDEAFSVIDGYGADRAAGILSGLPFTLRTAKMSDCEQYLKWANDPLVRECSFSPDNINPANHLEWFKHQLGSPHACLLIACDIGKRPIGQVRFNFKTVEHAWTIDVSVGKPYRMKRLSRPILLEALNWMSIHHGSGIEIHADVLHANAASKRLFESCGFIEARKCKSFSTYSWLQKPHPLQSSK